MVRLDPRYQELQRNLEAHRAATQPQIRWCRECQEHLADATGLCPICKDERPSNI